MVLHCTETKLKGSFFSVHVHFFFPVRSTCILWIVYENAEKMEFAFVYVAIYKFFYVFAPNDYLLDCE